MYTNNGIFWNPVDADLRLFLITFQAVKTPRIHETNFTESVPDIIYDLKKVPMNSFLIGTASGMVELYAVSAIVDYLCEYMIYNPDRTLFVLKVCHVPVNPKPLMPLVYSAYGSIPIYASETMYYPQVFLYFRMPDSKFVYYNYYNNS